MSRTVCFNVPPNGPNGECVKNQTNKTILPAPPNKTQPNRSPRRLRQCRAGAGWHAVQQHHRRPTEPPATRPPPPVLAAFAAEGFCARETKPISVCSLRPQLFLRLISCGLNPRICETVLAYDTRVGVYCRVSGRNCAGGKEKRNKTHRRSIIFLYTSVQSIKMMKYCSDIH